MSRNMLIEMLINADDFINQRFFNECLSEIAAPLKN